MEAAQRAAEPEPVVEPVDTGPTPEEICQQQREENYQLTQEAINEVMRGQTANFRPCFMAELERNPDVGMIRIVWLITSEGQGINWDVVPQSSELLSCLEQHFQAIRFPCIRAYRQRARFGVQLARPQSAQQQGPQQTQQQQPQSGGWGPPPPGTVQDGGVTPDQYPDQYPEELPE
jgi:hypothetical protein